MLMRKIFCSRSVALDSAPVKCDFLLQCGTASPQWKMDGLMFSHKINKKSLIFMYNSTLKSELLIGSCIAMLNMTKTNYRYLKRSSLPSVTRQNILLEA